MNEFSLKYCTENALSEINNNERQHIKNEKTLHLLNCKFRENSKLCVPYFNMKREPAIFSILPEFRNKIVKFCNEKISAGNLSTNLLCAEIKKVSLVKSFITTSKT